MKANAYNVGIFYLQVLLHERDWKILFSNIVPCLDLDQVNRFEFFEQEIDKILRKLVKYVQFLS